MPSMDKRYVLGVDIGGTNIRMGIVDSENTLSDFERRGSQALLRENAVPNLVNAIRGYLSLAEHGGEISGIAVGVPGQVNKDHSQVYSVPKVQGLENRNLGAELAEALGLPVFVDHDVNLLLLHDIRAMELDPERNRTILAFYLGTGFGNSMYLNGSIHLGKHGVAGELGHIPLYGVEDVCNCGAAGCVETRCCGQYLAQLVSGEFPDCLISDIFTRHGDDPRIQKFVRDCALPIATEVTLLDPDYILLGGGVITMRDFPLPLLEEEIRRRTRHPLPAGDLHFVYASDSQANGVLGGGMAVLEWLENKR